ncbi:Protein of unknown function, DUF538 [Melia azedarach]|uniref:Uncharacterized protein n=1 Tax=Melia azedarach TaxID=155640 RepID=A0ACC1YG29_MELAZ|nr:Protein of unknown function, DUF538 [Melia azedarach]
MNMITTNFFLASKTMSSSAVTEAMKAKAEVYHGDETCRAKFTLLLADIGLPVGLMTIEDIEECGYVKEIGFVWLKQKQKKEHKFENVVVWFDAEVTAYFEKKKIKKLTGVKAKEFLIWISVCEIYVGDDNGSSITFKTPAGLSKAFPISVFQSGDIQDRDDWNEVKKMEQRREICAVQRVNK